MIVEGVNFHAEVVSGMTKEEFINRHIDFFWTDKDKATRRKILERAYELTAGKPAKSRKRKAESQ